MTPHGPRRWLAVALAVGAGCISVRAWPGPADGGADGALPADVATTDLPRADLGGDLPTTDVPTTDVAFIDVPNTDVPNTDVPFIDVPNTDVPNMDVPFTDVPNTDVPNTDVPNTDVPNTDVPNTDVPNTDVPNADVRSGDPADVADVADVAVACGRPGLPCCAGDACSAGACTASGATRLCCAAPTLNCGGACVDLATSPWHCGACGRACRTDVGTPDNACSAGTCRPTCATGFGDCDGDPANGCEANLLLDLDHCGACANRCPTRSNATISCRAGACGFTCSRYFADCDRNPANGCEANLQINVRNCGACGNACTNYCTGGVCY